MHLQAKDFTLFVKSILGKYFVGSRVLDVGSGDINGNNRFLFENCQYDGNDVIQAPNVSIVAHTKDLPFDNHTFDTIISTECFEHDPEYRESFLNIYRMLKPNGLFCFTCASTGRLEHGTRRTSPGDSFGTIGNIESMSDYYKNLTVNDLNEVLPLNQCFSTWSSYYNDEVHDLYFVGIKRGGTKDMDPLVKYEKGHIYPTYPDNSFLPMPTCITPPLSPPPPTTSSSQMSKGGRSIRPARLPIIPK
jgi:SAM-dependent methyltransferase